MFFQVRDFADEQRTGSPPPKASGCELRDRPRQSFCAFNAIGSRLPNLLQVTTAADVQPVGLRSLYYYPKKACFLAQCSLATTL